MTIQLVVAAAGHDSFILDGVDATSPVAVLRLQIAERLRVDTAALKLVVDGVELLDGVDPALYRIADFYVANLATVRCILPTPPATAAAAAPAAVGADAGAPSESVLQDEEATRAIVVLGLPRADAAATEEALFKTFSSFGEISRLLFQDEPPAGTSGTAGGSGGGGAAAVGQRAVVVFYRDAAAVAALAADGTAVLGRPARVVLATNLPALRAAGAVAPAAAGAGPAAHGTAPGGGGRVPLIAPVAAAAVASLLAQGAIFGERGIAHLRRYDDTAGLSRRVKVMLGDLDARYHIVSTVRAGYETAAAQAHALNAEYKVQETVELGVANALATAAALAQRAMANPLVAQVVTSGQSFVKEALQTVETIAAQAREEVRAARNGGPPPMGAYSVQGSVIAPPPAAGGGGLPPPAAPGSPAQQTPQPLTHVI